MLTQRNGFLDFSKGVLIVLVVTGHAVQYVIHRNAGFWEDPLFKLIYLFHMPLFMAISGYLSCRGVQSASSPAAYAGGRALTYLWPIVSWTTIYQCVSCFAFGKLAWRALPASIWDEAVASLWFLWALMAALAIVALSRYFKRYQFHSLAILLGLALLLPDIGHAALFKYTLPFFLAGYCSAACGSSIAKFNRLPLVAAGIVVVAVGFHLWHQQTYVYTSGMVLSLDNATNIALRWTVGAIGSLVALAVMQKIHGVISRRSKSLFERLGRDSLSIYILQGYVFIVLLKRVNIGSIGPLPGALVGLMIGVAVSLICWQVGRLLALNRHAARILFGMRSLARRPLQQAVVVLP